MSLEMLIFVAVVLILGLGVLGTLTMQSGQGAGAIHRGIDIAYGAAGI